MKTRRGSCYPCTNLDASAGVGEQQPRRKRRRVSSPAISPAAASSGGRDLFEELPDDLVVSVLADVAAAAGSPSDLANAMLTCKRFKELGQQRLVLAKASPQCLGVRAKAWSDSAHRFLKRCSDAGNLEACYILGMIRFYCLGSRGSGAALMAAAAVGGHASALYSLAVIQFNGSGGGKDDRDLRAGAALCARAASLGHVDALRELGHCLQDGYGVRRSVPDGRRLLIQANARELATTIGVGMGRRHSCLLSDFGCRVAASEAHPANRFLVEWFALRPVVGADGEEGLRLCSHVRCGRPETRRHEFRRCSVCGVVNYCSRACQALHWKMSHKAECTPMDRWLDAAAALADIGIAAGAAAL